MNDKCFEIGAIQAFLDGETTPELSFEITTHAAACSNCAQLMARAEEENSLVFGVLERELNSLVPTQRLWSSITVAIAEEKRQHSLWDKIRSGIMAAFANSSITVAASVLLVFSIFATIWALKPPTVIELSGLTFSHLSVTETEHVNTIAGIDPIAVGPDERIDVKATNFPPDKIGSMARNAIYRPESGTPRAQRAVVTSSVETEVYLPGEESYVRTIADLKENVDGRKDLIMSPSTRVSFERDLAVVNDSIKKMKEVVSRNPKNQAAKQVLYSSYQNKIDLLNSVVEREELMASMQ